MMLNICSDCFFVHVNRFFGEMSSYDFDFVFFFFLIRLLCCTGSLYTVGISFLSDRSFVKISIFLCCVLFLIMSLEAHKSYKF